MARWIGVSAALLTICAIIVVLPLGVLGHAGSAPFEAAVVVLTLTTPVASVLLAYRLWRHGHSVGALVCATPLALMAAGTALGVAGRPPRLSTLLWLDLYVLLAFVVILAWYGRVLLRASPAAS